MKTDQEIIDEIMRHQTIAGEISKHLAEAQVQIIKPISLIKYLKQRLEEERRTIDVLSWTLT